MKLYWYRFINGFDVTYHLEHDWTSRWRAIRGVQIGPWFIGAIKGEIKTEEGR